MTTSSDPAVQAFAQRYVEVTAPAQQAFRASVEADHLARQTPCTCPPGQYDARPTLAALRNLVGVWADELVQLEQMQSLAPPVAAGDFPAVVDAKALELRAGQAVLAIHEGQSMDVLQSELVASIDALAAASAKLRSDVGLPAA